jgi:hypothetical protein
MERETSLIRAKKIMGENFIGLEELVSIKKEMGIHIPDNSLEILPKIDFPEDLLERCKNDYLLILGIPFYKDGSELTIVKMREHFGCDPEKSEPCFYNQDWYLHEEFSNKVTFEFSWYLIKKEIEENFRGKIIDDSYLTAQQKVLPSSLLCAYTFFCCFYIKGQYIWQNDFVWCNDHDSNDDQIYVGRYFDQKKNAKPGFSIHRYLKINKNYGYIFL